MKTYVDTRKMEGNIFNVSVALLTESSWLEASDGDSDPVDEDRILAEFCCTENCHSPEDVRMYRMFHNLMEWSP